MDNYLTSEERQWAMFIHISALTGFVIPFGNIIGPLVLWQIKKDQSQFIDFHGKEAVNFQISMTIYLVVSFILIILLIGILLVAVIGILEVVFLIIAALKANDGVVYYYPLTIRFLR